MSDSSSKTEGTERNVSAFEAAYRRLRVPIERCRCLEEFALVPQHVRLEGLVILQGSKREIAAKGVHMLIRTQPVGEPPADAADAPSSQARPSWFDTVPEGEALQRCTDLFIDHEEIAEFTTGLQCFMRIPEGWPPLGPRCEAVFAWDTRLVFRAVRGGYQSEDFLTCATDSVVSFGLPPGRLFELVQWLRRVSAAFAEAEDD